MNTKTKNKESEKLDGNANNMNNKDSLIEYKEIEGTPFQVVRKTEENGINSYFVMFGKYRISEKIDTEEEATEEAAKLDWWKIMSVAHAIAEQLIEQDKIKQTTKLKKV